MVKLCDQEKKSFHIYQENLFSRFTDVSKADSDERIALLMNCASTEAETEEGSHFDADYLGSAFYHHKEHTVEDSKEEKSFHSKNPFVPVHSRNNDVTAFEWQGACIHTVVERTVLGIIQSNAYCSFVEISFKPNRPRRRYCLG